MNKFFRRLARPLDRGQYGGVALFSLWCAMELMNSSKDEFPGFHLLWLIMAVLYGLIWPNATAGRLASIGWSRWWALAVALPWIVFIGIANRGSKSWTPAALFAVILAQLPLLLIKGRQLPGINLGVRAPTEPRG